MSYSVGQIRATVGKPTIRVWDPIVSEVLMACPCCGRKCFVALNGRTLLDPRHVRPMKAKTHDKVTHAALRHETVCEGMRRG